MPSLRRREPGFVGLAHIICGQQLSTASAAAIWARLSGAFDPFDHDACRRARTDRLGRLGLSAAQIKTLKSLHRSLDRRCLSAVLSRPWRRLACRRPRGSGGDPNRPRAEGPAQRQANGANCGTLAADARRRGAFVVELLPRDQEARRGDRRRRQDERCFKHCCCCKSTARREDRGAKRDGIETCSQPTSSSPEMISSNAN